MESSVIRLVNLEKSFGEKKVLESLSHTFSGGSVCIMGPSGCGKTTLMRIMLGLVPPDSGSVLGLEGKKLSVVFQEDRLCESFSALANVLLVCSDKLQAAAILAALNIEQAAKVSTLSGGQKRRVAIARALAADFDFLFLDEPFRGLDKSAAQNAAAVIKEQLHGKKLFLVSHSEAEAALFDAELFYLNGKEN